MREIKFRAWDKHNKTWITDPVGFTMSVVDGKFHVFGFDDAFTDMYQIRVELQQYTGLLDKNGKEIYEGDLLRWNAKELAYPVEWMDGGFHCGGTELSIGHDNTVIVGNIYENPELLK